MSEEEKAAPKEAEEAEHKSAPYKRSPEELSVLDIAGGVLFLVLSALLVGNCYVAFLGKTYNDRFLAESIALAGKAANEGLDTPNVQLAAFGAYKHCAESGFMVEHPEFTSFKDEITPELRVVTISSRTRVVLPAPFLVMDRHILESDGNADSYNDVFPHATFKSTYQYRLTNPKNIRGTLIRTPKGIIKVPKGDGDKDKAGNAEKKDKAPPKKESAH